MSIESYQDILVKVLLLVAGVIMIAAKAGYLMIESMSQPQLITTREENRVPPQRRIWVVAALIIRVIMLMKRPERLLK